MEEINWCVVPEEYILSTARRNKIGKWEYRSYSAIDIDDLQTQFSYFIQKCQDGHKSKDEMMKRGTDYEFAVFSKNDGVEKLLKYEVS